MAALREKVSERPCPYLNLRYSYSHNKAETVSQPSFLCKSNAFLVRNCFYLVQISVKFVPKGSVDNMSSLVQVMAG